MTPGRFLHPMQDPNPQDADPGRELMLAFQQGADPAFERIIGLYSERAYALFVRFTGRHEGCEDLVQELFLRMWRARDRYQPTARFSTWMYRIAFNLAANEGERRKTRSSLSLERDALENGGGDWEDDGAPQPSDAAQTQDVVQQVREAIAALPETQRMALILARYEELSHHEIGEALGLSAKAVKSLIHRARESLRSRLANMIAEDLS